jgi:hypothetical protein
MRTRVRQFLPVFVVLAAAVASFASPALASQQLTDVDITFKSLQVNAKGEALVTYVTTTRKVRHVLLWGAINANAPVDPSVKQVQFRRDYAGGWGKYRKSTYWKTFKNGCTAYDGPPLAFLVAACKAPDGTYWAVQAWQRGLPLLGFDPWKPGQTAFEFHVSHWSGDLPKLEVYAHWTYAGQWQGLFGRVTYLDQPVHGFGSTGDGNPRDRYGRNVYIDTFNSAYGAGWRRESGILVHKPTGTFCHSFVPQKPFPGYPSQAMRPPAPGERYRVTVMGPGVTPVVEWEGPGLTAADRASAASITVVFDTLMAGDARCAAER